MRHLHNNRRNSKYIKLVNNVSCIPSGIYHVSTRTSQRIDFNIGRKILFSIINGDNSLFEKPSPRELRENITTIQDFVHRYYQLLNRAKPSTTFTYDPTKPMTCCFLDESLITGMGESLELLL